MSICNKNDSYRIFCSKVSIKMLNKAHLITNIEFPQTAGVVETTYEKLSQEIWHKFLNNCQSIHNFCKKIQFWNQLNEFIKLEVPQYGLFITGCTLNGFGLKDNYVEMVLLEKSLESNRKSALICFEKFVQCLTKHDDFKNIELVHSLVPTVNFYEVNYKLDVKLNYNHLVSIRNTYLLYCYSQVDWRVRPLVIMVKLWARYQDINNPRYGTLSSYSLILMVIHFLQYGLKPAILPCLQNLFEYKFKNHCDIEMINFFDQLEIPFYPKNNQTLGELLVEFFGYYNAFQFDRYIMSVRLGTKISRVEYQKDRVCSSEGSIWWKHICIEDPFDLSNASKSVYDILVFKRIKKIISESYIKLKSTHDLSSILGIL